jgi:hypothetical protein
VQSTHTLGARKTTLWVFNDIKKAIEIVGIQYISFVVLDGACAAVLKMIDTDLQKVFGIRCVTHAWSLLCKDLCSLFEDEVKICTKLIQFVVNHDFMYNYLTVTLKAAHLVEVADARFATLVYAIERIIADKAALRSLWFSQDTIVWVGTQTTAIKDAFNYLEQNLIVNESMWKALDQFKSITEPCKVALRASDSYEPTMTAQCAIFKIARAMSITAAQEAERCDPTRFVGMELNVIHYFNKRHKDINSPWLMAASTLCLKPEDAEAGGEEHMMRAIRKYFRNDIVVARQAELFFAKFYQQRCFFAEPETIAMRQASSSPSDFWGWVGMNVRDPAEKACCQLFLKFCEGYPGQGAAERMNKSIKFTRSSARNRQEHLVTEAYVKIQNSLKIEASYKKSKVEHVPFLQRIKEHFSEKKQEISDRFDIEEEERIAQEEERMAQEEDEKARDEEDTVPLDDEYANDEDVEEFFNAFIEENIIAMSEYSV